ncbi:glutamate ABC transporter substrate-binding protein [Salininema proteolyticum]|uniref:Glutamate ABC transporter substrate-binding protein n=1 Tax=Salininema proteolyticum TaxID=1607685 RepID=A0ABV8U0J5_9ACTN
MRIRTTAATAAASVALLTGCSAGQGINVDEVPVPQPLPEGATVSPDLEPVEVQETCEGGFDRTQSLKPSGASAAKARAQLNDEDVISIGVSQTTNLMGYRDPSTGRLGGFDIDIATELAKAIGGEDVSIHWVPMTSGEREDALDSGRVDFVVRTMSMTCARWENIEFSSVYLQAHQKTMVDSTSGIETLDDLTEDHTVCSSGGSTSLPQVLEQTSAQALTVKDFNDCISLLQRGTVDAFTTDDTILAGHASQDPNLFILPDAIAEEPYGVGVAKGSTDLVEFINETLEKMREDGRWEAAYGKWLEGELGKTSPPKAEYR